MEEVRQYADAVFLSKLDNLELASKIAVEGFFAGLHKSPFHGFSVEYSDHRSYQFGDDLKYLDWKAYARSDRLYVKQFEQETNTDVHVLLDCSASMGFGSGEISKFGYGKLLGAALGYMGLKQNDRVGLRVFSDDVVSHLPGSSRGGQLNLIYRMLSGSRVGGGTNLGGVFEGVAESLRRRGIVVLISDMLGYDENARRGLARLRHCKHDVICFHVLDRQELRFDYSGLVDFEGIEGGFSVKVNAGFVRKRYLRGLGDFVRGLRDYCGRAGIDYCLVDSSDSPGDALGAYLNRRRKLV